MKLRFDYLSVRKIKLIGVTIARALKDNPGSITATRMWVTETQTQLAREAMDDFGSEQGQAMLARALAERQADTETIVDDKKSTTSADRFAGYTVAEFTRDAVMAAAQVPLVELLTYLVEHYGEEAIDLISRLISIVYTDNRKLIGGSVSSVAVEEAIAETENELDVLRGTELLEATVEAWEQVKTEWAEDPFVKAAVKRARREIDKQIEQTVTQESGSTDPSTASSTKAA